MTELIERPIAGLGIGPDGNPQYYVLMRAEAVHDDGTVDIIGNTPLSPPLSEKQFQQLDDQIHGALAFAPSVPRKGLVEVYITFGVQYTDDNPHPQGMHKDGVFSIFAPSRELARKMAFMLFDQAWSFDYLASEFSEADMQRHHPRGIIGTATLQSTLP